MTVFVTSAADLEASPPITSSLLKKHISILPSEVDHDDILDLYLPSAVSEFESKTKKAVITQTYKQIFDCFPCENYFLLERSPLVTFTDIQYYDSSDTLKTLASSVYSVEPSPVCPFVQLKTDQTWPSDIHPTRLNCVEVTYSAGFGANALAIPADIRRLLAMIVGDSFLFREDTQIIPGVAQIIVTPSSFNGMQKYYSNYFEHKSQKRR